MDTPHDFGLFMLLTVLLTSGKSTVGLFGFSSKNDLDRFQFRRIEPGNDLGITTKVIAHIHRPAFTVTEIWRFNREFTPTEIVEKLNSVCGDELIESKLKWSNCELDKEGLKAELTYGATEQKNKTLTYIEMSYKPFKRTKQGKEMRCTLSIVSENPSYFLIETYSKLPSNNSFPRSPQESVDTVHQHRLGRFSREFLSIYGNSIDQDGIYNFDLEDHILREQLYECFLSIGSSESAFVIEEKCPITCVEVEVGGQTKSAEQVSDFSDETLESLLKHPEEDILHMHHEL